MDQKLKGFFDTAQKKADETTAAQTAQAEAEAQRRQAQSENERILRQQLDAELTPILSVLQKLPVKEHMGFEVNVREFNSSSGTEARVDVNVAYKYFPRPTYPDCSEPGDDARPKPEISMRISRDKDTTAISITQYAMIVKTPGDYRSRYKNLVAKDFEEARQELGAALGTFAADRMAEIGAGLGATPQLAAASAAPGAEDSKIDVFRKPLAFKGAAQPSAQEKTIEAPAPETSADAKTPAPKKRFWQRWSL